MTKDAEETKGFVIPFSRDEMRSVVRAFVEANQKDGSLCLKTDTEGGVLRDENGKLQTWDRGGKKGYPKSLSAVPSREDLKDSIKEHIPADVALWGRMVTSQQALSVEAAMSVSHGMSVYSSPVEFDYYTASDDLVSAGAVETQTEGTAHIGNREFASGGSMYVCVVLDLDLLKSNSPSEWAQILSNMLQPILVNTPKGMAKSFASYGRCDYVCAVRSTKAISAFEAFHSPKDLTPAEAGAEIESHLDTHLWYERECLEDADPVYVFSPTEKRGSFKGLREFLLETAGE